jgi:DnaK suppressor protein
MRTAIERTLSNQRLLRQVQQKLESEQREITAALDLELHPGEELAEGWQEIDSPAERELREVEYLHRERLIQRLRLIADALERIDEGSYGLCLECGKKIARKRLKNDPATALCLACRQASEKSAPRPTL